MAKIEGNKRYFAGDTRINADGTRERLTPLRVNDETIDENGFKKSEISMVRIGYKRYPCRLEWVPEEWYAEYMKMEWADVKAEEREGRCFVPDGKGSFIRCPESNRCCACKKIGSLNFDSCLPTSIDKLAEEADFDVSDKKDPIEDLTWEMLTDDVEAYIREKSPESAEIFRRTYNQQSQTEIAKEMGFPIGSMGRKMDKMHRLAQELMKLMEE